jgi:hypothetical protein
MPTHPRNPYLDEVLPNISLPHASNVDGYPRLLAVLLPGYKRRGLIHQVQISLTDYRSFK